MSRANQAARDSAFREIEARLQSIKCSIHCAAIALDNADDGEFESVARATCVIHDQLGALEQLQRDLDAFNLQHLRPAPSNLLRAVRS